MENLKDIIKTAEECQEILKKVKTVADVINLKNAGIPKEEIIRIDIGNGNGFDEYNLSELDPDKRVYGITLELYGEKNKGLIDYPTLQWVPGNFDDIASFCFDLYEYDSRVVLEEVTLGDVEDLYNEYVSKNCLHLTDIKWDADDTEDLPTEIYVHKHVPDISKYLSAVYGCDAHDYLATSCEFEQELSQSKVVYVLTGQHGETFLKTSVYEDRNMAFAEAEKRIAENVLKEYAATIVSDGINISDTNKVLEWAENQKLINRYECRDALSIYTTYENPDDYHDGWGSDERWNIERCKVIKGE